MKRLNIQKEVNPHYKLSRIIRFGLVALVFVVVLEVWMVNRLATYGENIQELKKAQSMIILENQTLENSIAEESTLALIEEKAGYLGLDKIKHLDSIQPALIASVR
ncbi:MAG: hypothetical protein C4584_00745 [Armatimonadetes bacterium]|nr:MAG: hypothetical protein C4584_00745 [Armatimonadota bacterium]